MTATALLRTLGPVVILLASVPAQATWVVDPAGGPGVDFTSLQAAVASPIVVDGDTILVSAPPTMPSETIATAKGLTIVGVGAPPMPDVAVSGLPAGRAFRLVGFTRYEPGHFSVNLLSCDGSVHLEDLQSIGAGGMSCCSVTASGCESVTMRGVTTYGDPAVGLTQSVATLVSCRLGYLGTTVIGGRAVIASQSVVDIVDPDFHPGLLPWPIQESDSTLRISGDASSRIEAGPAGSVNPAAAVFTYGGTVTIDPAITLVLPGGSAPILGTGTFSFASVPASWTLAPATPGQMLSIRSTAPANSAVFQALGVPGPLTSTPLGLIGIDTAAPFGFFPVAIAPASGVLTNQLLVPVSVGPGQAFTSQSVSWDGNSLRVGTPVTFTTR